MRTRPHHVLKLLESYVCCAQCPGEDGSRLMLLQSLLRPDLGVTILLLDSSSSTLIGGDESWTPDMAPLVRAKANSNMPHLARHCVAESGMAFLEACACMRCSSQQALGEKTSNATIASSPSHEYASPQAGPHAAQSHPRAGCRACSGH